MSNVFDNIWEPNVFVSLSARIHFICQWDKLFVCYIGTHTIVQMSCYVGPQFVYFCSLLFLLDISDPCLTLRECLLATTGFHYSSEQDTRGGRSILYIRSIRQWNKKGKTQTVRPTMS